MAGRFFEEIECGERLRSAGTLLFYPAGVPHDNRFSAAGARCLNVRLSDSAVPPPEAEQAAVVEYPFPVVEAAYTLYDSLLAGRERAELQHRTARLLSRLASRREGAFSAARDPVAKARVLLENQAAEAVGLAEVARAVGIDRFRLARAFRARFGCSVGQYRHRFLIRRAREALVSTPTSLSEIAYRYGFADQSHFTRIFKRYTGLPPGRYRHARS